MAARLAGMHAAVLLSVAIAVVGIPLSGPAQAAGPPPTVAWTQSIQGGMAGKVDPNAAVLTQADGNVTFGGCTQNDPLEAIETWTSVGNLVGSRSVTASPDPQLCNGNGLTDAQGNTYSLQLDQTADTYDIMAFQPNGSNLWPAPTPLPTTCPGNPLSLGYSTPVLGADGNIYGLIYWGQVNGCPTALKLYGINHKTGALLFADTLNPDGATYTSDVSAYAGGLVVRSDNEVTYYSYSGGVIGGPYSMGGTQLDRDQGIAATTSGTAFAAIAHTTTPTGSCPLTLPFRDIEAFNPGGQVWRIPATGCNEALSVNAMPDGGVAVLIENYTTGGTQSSKILRYSSTGRLLWSLPASDMLVDINGNIITTNEYRRQDPANPAFNNEPELRVDVYNGVTRTEIYDFDTINFNDDNSYLMPVNQIGLDQGRLYLGLQDCPGNVSLGGGTCDVPPDLYAINAPGVGIDYPRGAMLGVQPSGLPYVALGDSYSSGEGNPPFINTTCDLSPEAWPNLLSDGDPSFRLVANLACSGAKASDALTSSYKGQPRQIPAMKALHPAVVTITIGGNDVGFGSLIFDCYLKSIAHDQQWCVSQLKSEAGVIQDFGKTVGTYYEDIKKSAGSARTIVAGYPRIFPPPWKTTVGCWWLSAAEQQGFFNLEDELNSVLSAAAQSAGLQYVPTLSALAGHELCTKHSWMNPIMAKVNYKYDAHPNLQGQEALARVVQSSGKL
jgi:lysophospholipase L1-like esterase